MRSIPYCLTMGLAIFLAAPAGAARVDLGSFSIDRTEVTVGAFAEYAARAGLTTTAEAEGGGFEWGAGWQRRAGWSFRAPQGDPAPDGEPAVHITWHEARAFCRASGGRLPTREEWALAAYTETRETPTDGFQAGRTYVYPVGDDPAGMNNNRRHHVAVGTTQRGVNGLFDMGANVWEWLADRRGDDALTAGGSWWYGPGAARADGMQWKPAAFHAVYVGFRCAYD
ncbi:MAG: formylglycine-generating enzyme family protein [Rhodobacteraceae bacterium]|nr:formylglycine-generating enzyme family protein [Paracoccaceae bacterium]